MKNHCLLLVLNDSLFKQVILSLLKEINDVEALESTADDVNGLLKEVGEYNPDTVLMEESSPFSTISCLFRLLTNLPGKPIVMVSQERNLMHVVHWRTVQVKTASDLIDVIGPV